MKNKLKNNVSYILAGLVNTLFGYGAYFILVYINIPAPLALATSTVLGILFNYVNFSKTVFKSQRTNIGLIKYILSYVIIYVINVLFLELLKNNSPLNKYTAQIAFFPVSIIIGWIFMNYWVFNRK